MNPIPDPTDVSINPLDRATDRLLAIEGDLTAAVSATMPRGDDSDDELLELLYGLLRARADIRTALDRVAVGRSGR